MTTRSPFRIWHFMAAVAVLALAFALSRTEMGRLVLVLGLSYCASQLILWPMAFGTLALGVRLRERVGWLPETITLAVGLTLAFVCGVYAFFVTGTFMEPLLRRLSSQ